MDGGEASALTKGKRSISSFEWSPDGKQIAFLSDTNAEDIAKSKKKETPAEPERESDVKIITRAIYRLNGEGYLDFKHPAHIWIVDVPANNDAKSTPKQLTDGAFDEEEPSFSRDGKQVVFHTDRNPEPYYDTPKSEIMSVPTLGGPTTTIAKIDMGIGNMALSPDGKQIAFRASATKPIQSYTQPDLWVLTIGSSTPKNLTQNYDFDIGNGVFGDNLAPRAAGEPKPVWSRDGSHIYEVVGKQGKTILTSIDTTSGNVVELTRVEQAV